MKRIFAVKTSAPVAIILMLASFCHAQDRRSFPAGEGDVYVEAAQIPSDSDTGCTITTCVRVGFGFLSFRRRDMFPGDSVLCGDVTISTTIGDSSGMGAAFTHDAVRVLVNRYGETVRPDTSILFHRCHRLQPGTYTISVDVEDGSSSRRRTLRLPITVRELTGSGPLLVSFIPLREDATSDPPFRIAGYGGNIPFGDPAWGAVAGVFDDGTRWSWSLVETRGGRPHGVPLHGVLESPICLDRSACPQAPGRVERFAFDVSDAKSGAFAVFRFPFDTLTYGNYRLTVIAESRGMRDTLTRDVAISWSNMPHTLRDPRIARAVMQHILTQEEAKAFASCPDEELTERILAYWRTRERTAERPWKRMMEEYFRRADYASFEFQTVSRPLGALSDRGKVYILYGPPERTERVLPPGKPTRETWCYPSLGVEFVFEDRDRNGDFRLVGQRKGKEQEGAEP
ncbi:MAG: GWxTD domain-containing protein [Bacteroidota bacterium]|nr:GWxTD domain-containing protein [Bacteroidota bacterium]